MGSALNLSLLGVPFATSSGATTIPTTNLLFDYRSENYNASTGNWVDSSGNNNTATQSDSTKRPSLEVGALNGYSALVFDGSNDTLMLPSGINNVAQYFAIFKSVGVTWNAYGCVLGNSTLPGSTSVYRLGGIFQPGNTNLYPDPAAIAVSKNGVQLSSSNNFDLAPISSSYFLMTLKPANQVGFLQIGAMENSFCGAIKLIRLAGYSVEQTGSTKTGTESILLSQYAIT